MIYLRQVIFVSVLFAGSEAFSNLFCHRTNRISSSPSRNSNAIRNRDHVTIQSKLFSKFDNVEQPRPGASVASASSKQKKKDLKTFNRYLEIESWKRGPAARDLEPVLRAVGEACKQINRIVQRAQTDDLYGVAVDDKGNPLEDTNIQGEVQQKLDVVCNAIMLKQFCGSSKGVIAAVASEEEDTSRSCPDVMVSIWYMLFPSDVNFYVEIWRKRDGIFQGDNAFASGEYVAVFDPIDGSKNIDSSLPVGTVFGIYKCTPGTTPTEETFLQKGNEMVAAGYCLYS